MAFTKMLWQSDDGSLKVKVKTRIRNAGEIGLRVKVRTSIRNATNTSNTTNINSNS